MADSITISQISRPWRAGLGERGKEFMGGNGKCDGRHAFGLFGAIVCISYAWIKLKVCGLFAFAYRKRDFANNVLTSARRLLSPLESKRFFGML